MFTLVNNSRPAAQRSNFSNSNCDTDAAMPISQFAAKVGAKSAVIRPSAVKGTLQVHFVNEKQETLKISRGEDVRPLDVVATPGPSLSARVASAKAGEKLDLKDTFVAPIYDEYQRVSGFSLFLQGEVKYGSILTEVTF